MPKSLNPLASVMHIIIIVVILLCIQFSIFLFRWSSFMQYRIASNNYTRKFIYISLNNLQFILSVRRDSMLLFFCGHGWCATSRNVHSRFSPPLSVRLCGYVLCYCLATHTTRHDTHQPYIHKASLQCCWNCTKATDLVLGGRQNMLVERPLYYYTFPD